MQTSLHFLTNKPHRFLLPILSLLAMTPPVHSRDFTVEDWAGALEHTQAAVRSKAMLHLTILARDGEPIDAAIPALQRCFERTIAFPDPSEIENRHFQAAEILSWTRPDLVVGPMLRELHTQVRDDAVNDAAGNYMRLLVNLDSIPGEHDDLLIGMLRRSIELETIPRSRLMLGNGRLLVLLARHARDQGRAGRFALEILAPALATVDETWYYRKGEKVPHGLWARDVAETVELLSGSFTELYPEFHRLYLWAAQTSSKKVSSANWGEESLRAIAALAWHDDRAWAFLVDFLGDDFANRNDRHLMLESLAEARLHLSEGSGRDFDSAIRELDEKAPDWRSADYLADDQPIDDFVAKADTVTRG